MVVGRLDVFLMQRYNEELVIAQACGGEYPDHLRWRWEDATNDAPVTVNMTEPYLEAERNTVSLRTVEQHRTSAGQLPSFLIGYAEEVDSASALHIIMHDPAWTVRDIEAKQKVVQAFQMLALDADLPLESTPSWPILLLMVQPYRNHILFEEDWLP